MIRRPVSGRTRERLAVFLITALLLAASTAPQAESPDVVISQVYGAGGNVNAVLRNDYVELFNRGPAPVSLTGMSIQYASATGTGTFAMNGVTALSGTLAPGQYYLVQLASGGTNGSLLPVTPDVSTTATNMAAAAGKVVLVNGTAGLMCNGSSTPCSDEQRAAIVDLLGWGTANFFEGAVGPTTTTTMAAFRVDHGCTDRDNNGTDFVLAAPNPRNTAMPLAPCAVDTPPSLSSSVPATGATGVALAANLTVTFSEPVTLGPAAFQLSCSTSGVHALDVSNGAEPEIFTLDPTTDFTSGETCTLTITGAEVTDRDGEANAMASNASVSFSTIEVCGDPSTRIHTIQGNGLASPFTGTSQVIDAVVTSDLQGTGQFSGYFVQQEDALADGDPATSEGLFVFSSVPVNLGDKVRVRGTVTEFGTAGATLTELATVTVLVCATGQPMPGATAVTLPVAAVEDWERYEGMRVSLPQALTVSETFTLARFGELVLSSGGRLPQPTNVAAPGAAALAQQALNDRNRIVLDDANNQQNIDPTRYPAGGLSASNTLRSGDRVTDVAGIVEQRFGVYRVQPGGTPVVTAVNLRPEPPAFAGGTLRVASFNVLNYFNGDGRGGGFPTARGATTPAEFERQRDKTIAAIGALDAGIVGLMELENDTTGSSAIEDLVAGLNEATAPDTYAFIDTGVVGTDVIRVALIYQPAVVTPFGQYDILDSSDDPEFIDTLNRPSLAQTFTQNSNGKKLTVVVNHLKSKGSDCNSVSDPDTGDGQGHCNVTRRRAAEALVRWLATDPTGAGDPDVLLIGDMNSYAKEDPITAILAGGYDDLIDQRIGAGAYSYVFGAQSGYLDHALASAVLSPRVTGVGEWHVNADEPVALDYNVEFKTANQVTTFYAPDAHRSSDHDPVVVDLNLIEPYDWTGFFSPVGELNLVHAGSAVPIKFSLGGNRGLDIFAAGSPSSSVLPCEGAPSGTSEPTVSAGGSSLSYDPVSDRYTYVWKTQKPWAGTCRELRLKLADGTEHSVMFSFTR